MFYIKQNIPCRRVGAFLFACSVEILTIEINLGKEKVNFCHVYTPWHKQWLFSKWAWQDNYFLRSLYKNCVLLGYLNIVRDKTHLQNFCEIFQFEYLIKKSTCNKGDTPTGIGHIITNIPKRFMKSMEVETGSSYHQKMITTIFCSAFTKGNPKSFFYRYYRKFDLEHF